MNQGRCGATFVRFGSWDSIFRESSGVYLFDGKARPTGKSSLMNSFGTRAGVNLRRVIYQDSETGSVWTSLTDRTVSVPVRR
jgi:hypothetical protein